MFTQRYLKLINRSGWLWFRAIYLFRLNQPKELVNLINNKDIPKNFRKDISSIVTGNLKPNKNSSSKLKTTAEKRLDLLINLFDYEDELQRKFIEFERKKSEAIKHKTLKVEKELTQLEIDFHSKYRVSPKYLKSAEYSQMIRQNFILCCEKHGTTRSCIKKAYEDFKIQVHKVYPPITDHLA